MVDPNKPTIDPRTTVVDGNTPPTTVAPTGETPPPATTPDNVVRRDDIQPIVPSGTSTTTTNTTTSVPISTSIPAEYTASSYAELIPQLEKRMAEYKPLSEEELKKLRRRQKVEGIISGISDAVSSVANLVFASQYAPNMYNPKEGMSAKAKERFDKEKAEREAAEDKWFHYAMTYGKLKDAEEQKAYQRGRDKLQDKIREAQENRAQAKADRDAAIADLRTQLMIGKISQQEAAAEVKRIEAEYADQYWNARVNRENTQAEKNRRWRPSAGGGKPYGTFDGVTYQTKADYDKAVAEAAKENGVPQTEQNVTKSNDGVFEKTSTRMVRRNTQDVARDVEKKTKNKKNGWASGLKL